MGLPEAKQGQATGATPFDPERGLLEITGGLVDARTGAILRGTRLVREVEIRAEQLSRLSPGLLLLAADRTVDVILWYLAAFRSARPVALIDPTTPASQWAVLARQYMPAVVIGGTAAAWSENWLVHVVQQTEMIVNPSPPASTHKDLGLLLQTSGSTGSPRMVRLSRYAVLHNAHAIGRAMDITEAEVAPTALPLFYSFGLSVLNSHLAAGATILVVDESVANPALFDKLRRFGATSLSGVPSTFQLLRLGRWEPRDHPTIRTLNQAGGRLGRTDLRHFIDDRLSVGGRLHIMWGQTEASPRMTTMPWESLSHRIGSVGLPLADGRVTVSDRELVYEGPNVMMGYADNARDLLRGHDVGGVLRTGDLGEVDSEGFVWITGRSKRIAKLYGTRYDLDDLERMIDGAGQSAITADEDSIIIHSVALSHDAAREIRLHLADQIGMPATTVRVKLHDALPLLPSGKVNYKALDS